ncbi:lysine methyltransferase [Nitzschia inconspicua]|uniref:Lysine methyltransferase n=1 Tax=Nitzschia inconspicua TaxID=303405 RepID=A0A9K3M1I2_9STRA|nr:lysine methyltransferase [Nitzschia inconspicua]
MSSTETPWIDAWIRWERDSKDVIDDNLSTKGVEKDEYPSPTKVFHFEYPLFENSEEKDSDDNNNNTETTVCTLSLGGFDSESEETWNSTGLTLWPCSHHLCDYLCQHLLSTLRAADSTKSNETINVLELGSGLGRCGLLAHHILQADNAAADENIRRHHHHIYMTDGDTDTLHQLRANVRENVAQKQQDRVSCHQLLWGEASARRFCTLIGLHSAKRNESRNTNELEGSIRNKIDLIIGSDLIYVPQVIEPLFETVYVLLQQPFTKNEDNKNQSTNLATARPTFVMAHSDRRQGSSVTLGMVLEKSTEAGLEATILKEQPQEGIYIIAFAIPVER